MVRGLPPDLAPLPRFPDNKLSFPPAIEYYRAEGTINELLWCTRMNEASRNWGLFKLSVPPVLGFAYLSANFGLVYAILGGSLLAAFSVLLFRRWGLPTSKKFVLVFFFAVALSWCFLELLPRYIGDNPTFLGVVGGIIYVVLWGLVSWFAGIRIPTPEQVLRETLDDPENVSPRQRVEAAKSE